MLQRVARLVFGLLAAGTVLLGVLVVASGDTGPAEIVVVVALTAAVVALLVHARSRIV